MDMATALAELSVAEGSLDPDARDQLDRNGYVPLPGVLSAGQLTAIRARLAELLAAGTVVVFNSHLWHGGTLNRSDRPRRALHSYFTRRANRQQLDQTKYIRRDTLARLNPPARFILDV